MSKVCLLIKIKNFYSRLVYVLSVIRRIILYSNVFRPFLKVFFSIAYGIENYQNSDFFFVKTSKSGRENCDWRGTEATNATLCILSTNCTIQILKNIIIIYIILSLTIARRRAFFRAHNVFHRHQHSRRGPLRILYEVVEPSTTAVAAAVAVAVEFSSAQVGRWYRPTHAIGIQSGIILLCSIGSFYARLAAVYCYYTTSTIYTAQTNLPYRKHCRDNDDTGNSANGAMLKFRRVYCYNIIIY